MAGVKDVGQVLGTYKHGQEFGMLFVLNPDISSGFVVSL